MGFNRLLLCVCCQQPFARRRVDSFIDVCAPCVCALCVLQAAFKYTAIAPLCALIGFDMNTKY